MLACRAIMYQPTISEAANILTDTLCGFLMHVYSCYLQGKVVNITF